MVVVTTSIARTRCTDLGSLLLRMSIRSASVCLSVCLRVCVCWCDAGLGRVWCRSNEPRTYCTPAYRLIVNTNLDLVTNCTGILPICMSPWQITNSWLYFNSSTVKMPCMLFVNCEIGRLRLDRIASKQVLVELTDVQGDEACFAMLPPPPPPPATSSSSDGRTAILSARPSTARGRAARHGAVRTFSLSRSGYRECVRRVTADGGGGRTMKDWSVGRSVGLSATVTTVI